jgi:hypothetical protein
MASFGLYDDAGRFELVTREGDGLVADALRLVVAWCGFTATTVDSVLDATSASEYLSSLRTTDRLPVLFDNASMVEAATPVAIVRYLWRAAAAAAAPDLDAPAAAAAAVPGAGAAGAGASASAAGDAARAPAPAVAAAPMSSTDALRADVAAETVFAWLRDTDLADPRAFATPAQRKGLLARVRLLNGVLTQSSAFAQRRGATELTWGDALAWYYLHLVAGWCGDDALAEVDSVATIYGAIGKHACIPGWSAARAARWAKVRTIAAAPAGAAAAPAPTPASASGGAGAAKGASGGKAAFGGGGWSTPGGGSGSSSAGAGGAGKAAITSAPSPAPVAAPPTAVAAVPAPRALPPAGSKGAVCVTGANGFIASWVVTLLLEAGYTVHATVRNLDDTAKYAHLLGMPGAEGRLKMFAADLLVPGSFDAAIAGCTVVQHCASPFFFTSSDPERELIRPAVEGTANVLRSAIAAPTVRRVVATSSVAAVYLTGKPHDHFYTDEGEGTGEGGGEGGCTTTSTPTRVRDGVGRGGRCLLRGPATPPV